MPAGRFDVRLAQAIERDVGRMPRRKCRPLTERQLRALLTGDGYRSARGLLSGVHFRKKRGRGCYHVRIHATGAEIHRDAWDPRRYPMLHLFETPQLWIPGVVLAVLALIVDQLA
jgi:hypothetical protein